MAAPTSTGSSTTCTSRRVHCSRFSVNKQLMLFGVASLPWLLHNGWPGGKTHVKPSLKHSQPTCRVDTSSAFASTGTRVPSSSCVSMGVATTAPSCAHRGGQGSNTCQGAKHVIDAFAQASMRHLSRAFTGTSRQTALLYFKQAAQVLLECEKQPLTVLAVVMATLRVTSARAR